jgi:hypothetical protein
MSGTGRSATVDGDVGGLVGGDVGDWSEDHRVGPPAGGDAGDWSAAHTGDSVEDWSVAMSGPVGGDVGES